MKKLLSVLLTCCLLMGIYGCHKQPDTTDTEEPSTSMQQTDLTPGTKELEWTMQGAWVDATGKAGEKVELKLKGTVNLLEDGESSYRMTFTDPEEKVAYSVLGVLGSEYSYTCCHAMGTEKGADSLNMKMYSAYFGLDYAKGCVIIDFDDEKDVYLIASIDSNADMAALWAHFQGFFDIRPEQWPQVSFG